MTLEEAFTAYLARELPLAEPRKGIVRDLCDITDGYTVVEKQRIPEHCMPEITICETVNGWEFQVSFELYDDSRHHVWTSPHFRVKNSKTIFYVFGEIGSRVQMFVDLFNAGYRFDDT